MARGGSQTLGAEFPPADAVTPIALQVASAEFSQARAPAIVGPDAIWLLAALREPARERMAGR